jgi:methionyl-tRNA formyltransferase
MWRFEMSYIWLSANKLGYELLKKAIDIHLPPKAIVTLGKGSSTRMYDGMEYNEWCKFDIPVWGIDRINDTLPLIKDLTPSFVIACGWRQIIGKHILDFPENGVIGFHPTLLPKGRGPAPIINTILTNFPHSGLTMFYMNEGVDDGDIIGQVGFEVEEDDFADDVYRKVIVAGLELVETFLPRLFTGTAPRIPQNHSEATVFPQRTVQDNEIDPVTDTVETMYRKIRAFSDPYLGAFLKKGKFKLVIKKNEIKVEHE